MARLNTNAEVWSKVSEFGGVRDLSGGFSGTLDAAAAKGDTSVDVTEDPTADIAAGDYVRIGSDDQLEVHEVDSVTGVGPWTIALTTALIKAHEVDDAVVEEELVNFGAVADDGVNVDHSGTQNEIQASTSFGVYVTLLQETAAEISCNLLNYSAENIAASLGIPESEITGTAAAADKEQIALIGEALDSVQNYSLYMRGARNDGSTFEVMGFDAAFDPNQAKNLLRGQQVNLPLTATVNGGVVFRRVA